ncbi:MAG: alpha/beta fold hydrolase [Dehalococcoidia bacterium]
MRDDGRRAAACVAARPQHERRRWFQAGYANAPAERFRVLVLELREHGESGKPHPAEAYRLPVRRDDVERVLDACGAERARAWGYSTGGRVVEGLAMASPGRVRSAVVGGWARFTRPPVEQDPRYSALQRGTRRTSTYWRQLPEAARQVLRAATMPPRSLLRCRARHGGRASRPRCSCEVRRHGGDVDPGYRSFRLRPSNQFVSLPGATHPSAFSDRAAILPTILAFLEAASAKGCGADELAGPKLRRAA